MDKQLKINWRRVGSVAAAKINDNVEIRINKAGFEKRPFMTCSYVLSFNYVLSYNYIGARKGREKKAKKLRYLSRGALFMQNLCQN